MTPTGPEIENSALIIVDMQNDFVHPDGVFGLMAKQNPERNIDHEFLASPTPRIQALAAAYRDTGRPVIHIAHVLAPDYSDAAFPYWRHERSRNSQFIVEGSWGAEIIDELTPEEGEHLVVKKGYGGFSNTPLDTILRNYGVTTCVVTGVTTCVCVSTTIRGGVENNYRMIIVEDGTAEVQRDAHAHELKTLNRVFADVKTANEVIDSLASSDMPMTA